MQLKLRMLVLLGVTMTLCACGVYPAFKPPAATKTRSYTSGDDLVNEQQHMALGQQVQNEWWSLFANADLNKVIKQAIADNYNLAIAKQTLAQAEEAVKSKRGSLWPQVALAAAATNQLYGAAFFGPATISIPAFTAYELGPTVNWTLDLFGATRFAIEQQKAFADYQAQNLDAVYVLLTGNIVAQALEIAAVKAELGRMDHIIAEDEKTFRLVQTKYEIGSATKLDMLNAQNNLESDRAQVPPLKQRLSIARHALSILVGRAPADWVQPDFAFTDFILPRELPLSLPSELVRKRPDIRAAEASLHAAHAAVGVTTANLYPNIVISGYLFQEALNFKSLFNGSATAWSIAANLTQPLFNGGMLRAEKRKAEHAYKASVAQYQQTILLAFKQVADALTALTNDAEAVHIWQKTVRIAGDAMVLAYKSYAAGATNLLQLQENQRELQRAEVNLIRAQRQQFIDTAQLFVALGGSPFMQPALEQTAQACD